jgi:hypothetical protein
MGLGDHPTLRWHGKDPGIRLSYPEVPRNNCWDGGRPAPACRRWGASGARMEWAGRWSRHLQYDGRTRQAIRPATRHHPRAPVAHSTWILHIQSAADCTRGSIQTYSVPTGVHAPFTLRTG